MPASFYAALGRRVIDGLALRPDRLERLSAAARQKSRAGPFAADPEFAGLAGVAFMGLAAFRGAGGGGAAPGHTGFSSLLSALAEPAAICAADGFIWACNPPWRQAAGNGRRLPKGGSGLFAALSAARTLAATT